MSIILLKIGIVLLPFYELLAKVLPFAVVATPDSRFAKSFLGLWLALGVGASACFCNGFRPLKNKWILLFLLFIPLSIHLSPRFNIVLNGVNSTSFWVWKPFVMILCYFLMFMGVQSLNITRSVVRGIFNVMVWCGFVMAAYVILQNFGWDQFFDVKTSEEFMWVTKPITVGNLGNSTIVSPYIAMLIPLALYLRRWIMVPIMIAAVWLTHSHLAIGAMIVSLCVYSCFKWRLKGVFAVFLALVLSLSVLNGVRVLNPTKYNKITDFRAVASGRVDVWKKTFKITRDEKLGVNKTRHPYTGTGLGSYTVIIKPLMENTFGQAHNEYLEVMCTLGIFGLFLFLMAILSMIRSVFYTYIDDFNKGEIIALFSSFICIALIATGNFVWQIAPLIFYSVVVIGLLHNRNLIKGELA